MCRDHLEMLAMGDMGVKGTFVFYSVLFEYFYSKCI